jgi:hypothetical protein
MSRGAVQYIEANGIRGRVINSYNLGNELLYRFYPEIRVSLDGRADVFGEAIFRRNESATMGRIPPLVEAIGVLDPDYIILQRGPAVSLVTGGFTMQHEWDLVFLDFSVGIFAKRGEIPPERRSIRL